MASVESSFFIGGISGKAGSVVVVKNPNGTMYLRPRVMPRNPKTPAQELIRALQSRASKAFQGLSAGQYQAWVAYCESINDAHRKQGLVGKLRPINAFTPLAVKVLQIDPEAEIPLLPPVEAFLGDLVRVSTSVQDRTIVFEADRPNQPGVVTELLLSKVTSLNVSPSTRSYRHQKFVAFSEGHLSEAVPVYPGVYATAIRFVNRLTGQVVALQVLGTLRV